MKIIKFEKDGCMLCKRMNKLLSSIGVNYETINLDEVDNAQDLIDTYNIMSAPTLIKISEDGFQSLSGMRTLKEIEEFCEISSPKKDVNAFEGLHCDNGACKV